jgi:type II secretory pathway component PulC
LERGIFLIKLVLLLFLFAVDVFAQVGFYITSVEKGSVYERVGLQAGDVILSFNGHPADVKSSEDLAAAMQSGAKIRLVIERKGLEKIIKVRFKAKGS